MKSWFSIFRICFFVAWSGAALAQNLDSTGMAQDSSLYCQIQKGVQGFACNDPAKDMIHPFLENYQKISGNSAWWMLEQKCKDPKYTCPILMRTNPSKDGYVECTLEYKIPSLEYDRSKIISYEPVQKGTCSKTARDDLQNYSWVRDYPMFIQMLNLKNKLVYEQEKFWWVARYNRNQNQAAIDQQMVELRKYYFVFLPGITGREQPDFYINQNFNSLRTWMNHNGIWNKLLKTQYNSPPQDNLQTIEQSISEITALGKQIIFVTHSKGGLDLINFLLKNPEYWNCPDAIVKGWITLQIPFWGATNAQDIISDGTLSSLMWAWQKWQNMSPDATKMLTPNAAFQTWCDSKGSPKSDIQQLLNSKYLKILEVKTWTERFNNSYNEGIDQLKNRGLKLKYPTDVCVWLPCANIPCVDNITLQGFNHWDFVKSGNKKYDPTSTSTNYADPAIYYSPIHFYQTLFKMMLEK